MARVTIHAMAFEQRIEIVARVLRIELAREFHRAQHLRVEGHTAAAELVFQKAVVEARVVRNEQLALQALQQIALDVGKGWRRSHHRVVDAGQRLNHRRYAHAGIDQCGPLADQTPLMDFDNAHFCNAIMSGGGAGGFQIDKNGVAIKHGETAADAGIS